MPESIFTGCTDIAGDQQRDRFFGLLVAFVAFLVYANSLGNGFVWDDIKFIIKSRALQGTPISIFTDIYPFYLIDYAPYYRPLTALTFLIEQRVHGLSPFPMHFFNVLLHGGNALLVYLLAQSLLKNIRTALLAGLLFAVHPINTEAVNFISTRNDLIMVFSVVMAFMLHRKSAMNNTFLGAMAGAIFFSVGLFSKESALSVFPLIVGMEIFYLRSMTRGGKSMVLARLLPYAAGAAFYLVMRSIALPGVDFKIDILSNLGTRLLDNLYVMPRYLLNVIWPASLSIKYYIPEDLHLLTLPLFAAWVGIIGSLVWLITRGRSQATMFGLAWFMLFLLPVSGIVPIPSAPLADRYLYAPAIGLWIIVADQSSRFCFPYKGRRNRVVIAIVVLLSLSTLTAVRNLDWKDEITLFKQHINRYPEQAYMRHNLGCAYLDKNDLDAAEREFEKAFAIDPFVPWLRNQMGYVRLKRKDYEGAVRHYDEALKQNQFDEEAYFNRAIALEKLGRDEDAVADYKRFLIVSNKGLVWARSRAEEKVRALTK